MRSQTEKTTAKTKKNIYKTTASRHHEGLNKSFIETPRNYYTIELGGLSRDPQFSPIIPRDASIAIQPQQDFAVWMRTLQASPFREYFNEASENFTIEAQNIK